jgi:ribA/ribD-fused uncharacterized protein
MTREKFTYFYGGPFSNWLHCEFTVDGKSYSSTEQYMMAEKARLFGDKDAEEKIMKTRDPQKAKIAGRAVKGFSLDLWNSKARDIVYKGCYAKFQQNNGLLHAIKQTKGTTLVEASPTDQIWGIGWDADDAEAQSRDTWRGMNWLGEVLTKVRDDLEEGVYRTDGFNWSDGTVSNIPVTIVNKTASDLWIWDNDKIKRWASELGNKFDTVKEVTVIVRDEPGYTQDGTVVEIEVIHDKGPNTTAKATSHAGSVLETFNKALAEVRGKLSE